MVAAPELAEALLRLLTSPDLLFDDLDPQTRERMVTAWACWSGQPLTSRSEHGIEPDGSGMPEGSREGGRDRDSESGRDADIRVVARRRLVQT